MIVVYQKTRVGGMGGRTDREGQGILWSGMINRTMSNHQWICVRPRVAHASQSVTTGSLYLASATVCCTKPGPSLTSLCASTENRLFPARFRGCGMTCFGSFTRGRPGSHCFENEFPVWGVQRHCLLWDFPACGQCCVGEFAPSLALIPPLDS